MSSKRHNFALLALALHCLAAMLWVGGCASPSGAILQRGRGGPVWPAPPDPPRIAYLDQLRADKDLKPGKGVFESIGSALFGEEPPRGMTSPLAVCTDGASNVFVVDSGALAVHVFNLTTRAYALWRPPTGFAMPVAIAFDPAGRVLVSDSVKGSLMAFDLKGNLLAELGLGVLQRPCGIAVASDGRLFVADVGAHQIVVLSPSGQELRRLGQRGVGPGEFNYPTNLAFDHQGRLYVSDTLNFRVLVFSPELTPAGQIGRQGDLPGYFSQPKGIAVDQDDHIYVVDANFEAVQLFMPDGTLLMSMGREGHAPGEFWLPAGIHIDPSGRVWVADSYNQRVQVFQYLREGDLP